MCALDRLRTRPPPYRLAPSRPTSCGRNKADSGVLSDFDLSERFSARKSGFASARAPPLPPPAGPVGLFQPIYSYQ